MSQEVLAEGIKQLQERVEQEKRENSAQTITLDKSNKVSFPGYAYKFEASLEKIIVSIDIFKSGYECKTCKGSMKLTEKCPCETTDRPGKKYTNDQLDEVFKTLGETAYRQRAEMTCSTCEGDYEAHRKEITCPECNGRGGLLVLPETSKNLPTTGVVVSMGADCKKHNINYKLGDRVLFGAYAGQMIPTKAGIMFKIMDCTSVMCKIEGGEDLAAFDFVIQEQD